jgi:hypothetical protein
MAPVSEVSVKGNAANRFPEKTNAPNTAIPVATLSFFIQLPLVLIFTTSGTIAAHLNQADECPELNQ